jgi:hypothetical protein
MRSITLVCDPQPKPEVLQKSGARWRDRGEGLRLNAYGLDFTVARRNAVGCSVLSSPFSFNPRLAFTTDGNVHGVLGAVHGFPNDRVHALLTPHEQVSLFPLLLQRGVILFSLTVPLAVT